MGLDERVVCNQGNSENAENPTQDAARMLLGCIHAQDPDLVGLSIMLGCTEQLLARKGPAPFHDLQGQIAKNRQVFTGFVDHIEAELQAVSQLDTRGKVKFIADSVWKRLTGALSKDVQHAQSIASLCAVLEAGTAKKGRRELDCAGVALSVLLVCHSLARRGPPHSDLQQICFQVSEDHCFLNLDAGGTREGSIEVTTDTAAKRGLPVTPGAWSGWLYNGGHAVLCDPYMCLAAMVTSINPMIDARRELESSELRELQRELLELIWRERPSAMYPAALCLLGHLAQTAEDEEYEEAEEAGDADKISGLLGLIGQQLPPASGPLGLIGQQLPPASGPLGLIGQQRPPGSGQQQSSGTHSDGIATHRGLRMPLESERSSQTGSPVLQHEAVRSCDAAAGRSAGLLEARPLESAAEGHGGCAVPGGPREPSGMVVSSREPKCAEALLQADGTVGRDRCPPAPDLSPRHPSQILRAEALFRLAIEQSCGTGYLWYPHSYLIRHMLYASAFFLRDNVMQALGVETATAEAIRLLEVALRACGSGGAASTLRQFRFTPVDEMLFKDVGSTMDHLCEVLIRHHKVRPDIFSDAPGPGQPSHMPAGPAQPATVIPRGNGTATEEETQTESPRESEPLLNAPLGDRLRDGESLLPPEGGMGPAFTNGIPENGQGAQARAQNADVAMSRAPASGVVPVDVRGGFQSGRLARWFCLGRQFRLHNPFAAKVGWIYRSAAQVPQERGLESLLCGTSWSGGTAYAAFTLEGPSRSAG
eukprot:jgi/Botrbrau1/20473/Bobra.145_2s0034.2